MNAKEKSIIEDLVSLVLWSARRNPHTAYRRSIYSDLVMSISHIKDESETLKECYHLAKNELETFVSIKKAPLNK